MKIDTARSCLIWGSLSITLGQCLFLATAPAFGFPLQFPKNLDLLQVIGPVFLGYLGSAAAFIFKEPPPEVAVNEKFLGPLVVGPLVVYATFVVAVFVAFGYSNRDQAQTGSGMSVDVLSRSLSVALGILAATTSVISSNIFVAPKAKQNRSIPE